MLEKHFACTLYLHKLLVISPQSLVLIIQRSMINPINQALCWGLLLSNITCKLQSHISAKTNNTRNPPPHNPLQPLLGDSSRLAFFATITFTLRLLIYSPMGLNSMRADTQYMCEWWILRITISVWEPFICLVRVGASCGALYMQNCDIAKRV
jgi:hypothetical protein